MIRDILILASISGFHEACFNRSQHLFTWANYWSKAENDKLKRIFNSSIEERSSNDIIDISYFKNELDISNHTKRAFVKAHLWRVLSTAALSLTMYKMIPLAQKAGPWGVAALSIFLFLPTTTQLVRTCLELTSYENAKRKFDVWNNKFNNILVKIRDLCFLWILFGKEELKNGVLSDFVLPVAKQFIYANIINYCFTPLSLKVHKCLEVELLSGVHDFNPMNNVLEDDLNWLVPRLCLLKEFKKDISISGFEKTIPIAQEMQKEGKNHLTPLTNIQVQLLCEKILGLQ